MARAERTTLAGMMLAGKVSKKRKRAVVPGTVVWDNLRERCIDTPGVDGRDAKHPTWPAPDLDKAGAPTIHAPRSVIDSR